MPTNQERREIAENLRTMTAYGCRYAEQFYELLKETVMNVEDFHDFGDVADRLADLIEPEPERTCGLRSRFTSMYCYECSECGRGMKVDWAYCPNCGAKVVE